MKYSSIISIEEIELAEGSKFWNAVKQMAQEWIDSIHFEMDDVDGGNDLGTYKKLTGNIQTARRIALIPEMIKDQIKYEYEQEREDKHDDD
jgi:ABC-type phosphonate transport system ATPase subunit